MKIKRSSINLFLEIFKDLKVPLCYSSISLPDKALLFKRESTINNGDTLYSHRLSPGYFEYQIDNRFRVFKIKQSNKGYAIFLNDSFRVDAYLKKQFKSKSNTITGYLNRLHKCFNVSSKMYYGEISKSQYKTLFDNLKRMVELRFNQKNQTNKNLDEWGRIYEEVYTLIITKKASIFVIYESDKPIAISLNYHFDKILFVAIPSYDINYSKFGLGHMSIYKQLEWCIVNKYKVLELGYGDLEYKRRWCNAIYNFHHNIIYPKKSFLYSVYAYLEFQKIKIKEYLKFKKMDVLANKIKESIVRRNDSSHQTVNKIEYEISYLDSLGTNTTIKEINWRKNEYFFLAQPVLNFLYANAQPVNTIKVYLVENNNFIIVGKRRIQKISIKF